MTRPEPPSSVTGDKRFVRDVAKQLDRQRMRRKMTIWSALLALIVAAAAYLRCGSGFGLGTGTGPGQETSTGEGTAGEAGSAPVRPVAGPRRCALRISPAGITVDGKPMSRAEAVAACKATPGVDAVVTGDTREGDWQELRAALVAAGIKDEDIQVQKPGAPAGSAER